MQFRTLGRTKKEVSSLGFGCWAIGGTGYGPTNDQDSLKALSFAYDHGITFYDTADVYGDGHSETLIGQTFKESSKRLKVFIATKAGWDFYHGGTKKNFSAEHIRFACGESLKRLKTDHIDLYQLHNPKRDEIEKGEVYKVLDELKKEGKILHYGTSIHRIDEGISANQNGKSDTLQVIFNLIDQRPVPELFPLCEKNKIGILAREPLACGLLTGKYTADSKFHKVDHRNRWMRDKYLKDLDKVKRIQDAFDTKKVSLKQAALEYVLSFSAVSTVIPGMKTAQHVEDHLKAVEDPRLSSEEISKIQDIYESDEIFKEGFYHN